MIDEEGKMKKAVFILIVFFVLLDFIAVNLEGVPVFARKHKLSCKTCHDPFPRLKPFGEEFAGNGFTIEGKVPSRYYRDTGDDKLSLLRSFPVALRMDLFVTNNRSGEDVFDLGVPYNIKLVSGGVLAKDVSYYFYFFFSEHGEIAGLEDAFIMFNDVFGTGVALAIGQFAISDPLLKGELKLTFERYKIYRARPGYSHLDLSYDRGLMLTYTVPKGGPDLTLEILNGTGIGEADELRNFDDDSLKNYLGRISQGLGKNFRIGAVGYTGKESAGAISNKVTMWGGDFTLSFHPMEVNFQYLQRTDRNPFLMDIPDGDIVTKGAILELIYTFPGVDNPWYMTGMYNWIDSDDDRIDYSSVAAHVGYLYRRNIRMLAEVNYVFNSFQGKYLRLVAGIIAAF